MKKIMLMVAMVGMVGTLAGCSTPAQRMADCQAQGISKDTCYLSEQNRQNSINNAAMKQAMENAHDAVK
jgi:maltose-binding protein MalE